MAKGYKVNNKVTRGDRFTDIVREARKQADKVVPIAVHRTVVGQLQLDFLAAKNREDGLRLDLAEANKEKQALVENWKGAYADKVKQLWKAEIGLAEKHHSLEVIADILADKKLDAIKKMVEGPSAGHFVITTEFRVAKDSAPQTGNSAQAPDSVIGTWVKKE